MTESRVTLPATINGQIMPGGVDRYRFSALQGQQLVISAGARALIPYLADAVPGWFEATVTIYDAKAMNWRTTTSSDSIPTRSFISKCRRTAITCIEIQDSIYRGREDFVYRMTIGELPFVTGHFPARRTGRRENRGPIDRMESTRRQRIDAGQHR